MKNLLLLFLVFTSLISCTTSNEPIDPKLLKNSPPNNVSNPNTNPVLSSNR